MLLSTAITDVKWRVDRAGHTQFSTSALTSLINEGVRMCYELFRDNPFTLANTTMTVTKSTTTYALPTDCQEVRKIIKSDGSTTVPRVAQFTSIVTGGTDSYYPIGRNSSGCYQIVLTPSQSDTYTVHYLKTPTAITTSSATLPVPEQYADLVVLYAMQRGFMFDENMQAYYAAKKEFDERFARLRSQEWKMVDYDRQAGLPYHDFGYDGDLDVEVL